MVFVVINKLLISKNKKKLIASKKSLKTEAEKKTA